MYAESWKKDYNACIWSHPADSFLNMWPIASSFGDHFELQGNQSHIRWEATCLQPRLANNCRLIVNHSHRVQLVYDALLCKESWLNLLSPGYIHV